MPAVAEIGRAFRKCATAMKGGDAPKRLADALAEIKRLEGERLRIRERLSEHSLRFRRHAERLDAKFRETGAIEDEIAAKVAWLVVAEEIKKAPVIRHGLLPPGVVTLEDEATKEFIANFDWRPPLAKIAEIRLATATAQFKQVEAEVKKSFAVLNLDEDINDDRRVKRLRRRVDRWENIQSRVEESDGADWLVLVKELSDGDT